MRRDVILPEEDIEFLDTLGLSWETIIEANQQWLVIYQFVVPIGYSVKKVDIAILITTGYPVAPLDMAYFFPSLLREDGKPINATQAFQQLDGKLWQRWSRHRSAQNPWHPGEDSLLTHFVSINEWLEREFKT